MVRIARKKRVYSYESRISNAELFGSLYDRLEVLLAKQRLRFCPHIWRSSTFAASTLFMDGLGKRKRGRPALTLPRIIMNDADIDDV